MVAAAEVAQGLIPGSFQFVAKVMDELLIRFQLRGTEDYA